MVSGLIEFVKAINLFDIFVGKKGDGAYFCADGPLWFIRELMIFVILSPILYWLVKKSYGLINIVWLAFAIINITDDIPNMRLLFFFSIGMTLTPLLGKPNIRFTKICVPFVIVLPILKMFTTESFVSVLFSYLYPIICFWAAHEITLRKQIDKK